MLKIRKKALKSYLQGSVKGKDIEVSEEDCAVLIAEGKNYLVLTDDEANERYDKEVMQRILECRNESIIIGSTILDTDDDSNKLLDLMRENNISNSVVAKLVDVPASFINDSKIGVGRGPILSDKEGVEHQEVLEHQNGDIYMYVYEIS